MGGGSEVTFRSLWATIPPYLALIVAAVAVHTTKPGCRDLMVTLACWSGVIPILHAASGFPESLRWVHRLELASELWMSNLNSWLERHICTIEMGLKEIMADGK